MYNNEEIINEYDKNMIHNDKIINNSYNTGEYEYEVFNGVMKVDERVYSFYEDQLSDNIAELRIEKELNETIYTLFEVSPYYDKYKIPKRVDKNDMIKMYYYFKEILLRKKIYSGSQIFIAFAEFFQINYDLLYNEIGIMDKETLLKELHNHKGIETFNKTKKLF